MAENILTCIVLNDGQLMPRFGLGCFSLSSDETKQAVITAVKEGYRLFDTAVYYNNEREVAKTLQNSGLHRNEYFIVTKLLPSENSYLGAKKSLKDSLRKMELDFVDLYLIHSPLDWGKTFDNSSEQNLIETWQGFCELKTEGLAKSIGVSNFNIQHLQTIINQGMLVPAVNQIEMHPWNQYRDTVSFCKDHQIAIMAYCPLARGKLFDTEKCAVISLLSEKYSKTKGQILLRWAVQKDYIPIPKSVNPLRIHENFQVFNWSLSNDDMIAIDKLDEGLEISIASRTMKKYFESCK
ncbi:2,5-diketo-D-gluconic acid reductase A [Hydra vulgaris]|uniref:2,5-diketo-D-gluconic acid reductase A n=1 Tax=Hydra vulgaris TaxID=6087 RepID=A0ABM4B5E1_HYDVU